MKIPQTVVILTESDSDGIPTWRVSVGRFPTGIRPGDRPRAADLPDDVLEALALWAANGLSRDGGYALTSTAFKPGARVNVRNGPWSTVHNEPEAVGTVAAIEVRYRVCLDGHVDTITVDGGKLSTATEEVTP